MELSTFSLEMNVVLYSAQLFDAIAEVHAWDINIGGMCIIS